MNTTTPKAGHTPKELSNGRFVILRNRHFNQRGCYEETTELFQHIDFLTNSHTSLLSRVAELEKVLRECKAALLVAVTPIHPQGNALLKLGRCTEEDCAISKIDAAIATASALLDTPADCPACAGEMDNHSQFCVMAKSLAGQKGGAE